MNQLNIHISIPKPCNENWSAMSPIENGRHCSSCVTNVVDFTGMAPDEIKAYFIKLNGQKVCGHFNTKDLVDTTPLHPLLQLRERVKMLRFIPLRYAALLLVGLAITISSCESKTTGEPQWEETPVKESKTLGAPVMTDDSLVTEHDSIQNALNQLPDSESVVIGDGEY